MLIEPRSAAPGALLRWSRQSLDLLRRGLGFWSALSLLMCLWMFVGHRLPLASGILALAALLSCMLIASRLDHSGRITLAEALEMLRAKMPVILTFAAIVAMAGAIVWVLLLAKPGVAWWNILYTERNSVDVLSADGFIALRQIFVYSAFALGLCYFGLNIPGLTSFFQFLCMTLLDLPFREAWRLGAAGQILNIGPMLGVALLFMVLPAVFALVLPPVIPVLYCFLGALGYVAFREIFLGIGQNQPREAAAISQATPLSSGA
ncbi:MAG: hypothetical protein RL412_1402 [Pseudomonadota bacterium]|jgi:hypothetical protein